MRLEWIEHTLEQKPAFRLLRANNAAFALECMFQAFPTSETIDRERSDMIAIISSRISERLAAGLEAPERQVDQILTYWSEQTPKWLTPRLGAMGEMTYTLSAGARDAMQFIEQARVDARISTESLMTSLMATIEDAASRLSGDAEHRIAHLKAKITEIELEIKGLEKNGLKPLDDDAVADVAARVQVETSQILAQLRELPDLIATFRNRSEELTYTDIRAKAEVMTDLLGHHEQLHATQAYRSMASMSHLYSQTSMRSRFEGALETTLHAASKHLEANQAKAIRAFMTSFTRATNAILDEERRVFEQQKDYLRRNESEQSRREKRAAMALNRALVRVREETNSGPASMALDSAKMRVSAFTHTLPRNATLHLEVKMPEPTVQADVVAPIKSGDMSASTRRACSAVALGKATSTEAIIKRIKTLLEDRETIALRDILALFPPRTGMKEIVQYLKISASHLPARYQVGDVFDITIPGKKAGRTMRLIAPNPIFVRKGNPGTGLAEFVARTRFVSGSDGRTTTLLLPDTDVNELERTA